MPDVAFSFRLRSLREAASMSQRELADACPDGAGITQASISKWESGIYVPSITQARLLADALNLEGGNRSWFFDGSEADRAAS